MHRLSVPILLGLLILAGALMPGSASAHSTGAPLVTAPAVGGAEALPTPAAAPPTQPRGPEVSWLLLGTFAGLVLLGAARPSPRRALVLSLVLLLGILAVEQGVHSLHHLGEREAAACAVASATGHLAAALDSGVPVLPGPGLAVKTVAGPACVRPPGVTLGLDPARAPPAPIA